MAFLFFISLLSISYGQNYPTLGSNESLDFLTWNIQNYPKHSSTNSYLNEIVDDISVDIIALQEIENQSSFNELINQLGGQWVGYRANQGSWYGELSYLINEEEIDIIDIYTILNQDEYFFAYRPPFVLEFMHGGIWYAMINNHFKCCGDGYLDLSDSSDEEHRRLISSQLLEEYVDANFSNQKVIILGDLNDEITDGMSNNVFWNFLESDDFQFADYDIATGSSSQWSYPTYPSHIDHIIVSDEIFPDFISSNVQTFKVDNYFDGGWSSYDYYISDHRPVFMKIDNDTVISGDMNSDGSIDVLDVVSIVNIILSGGFDSIADTNYDGVVNVIDVVILVNYILDTDITQNNFIIR